MGDLLDRLRDELNEKDSDSGSGGCSVLILISLVFLAGGIYGNRLLILQITEQMLSRAAAFFAGLPEAVLQTWQGLFG